MGSALAINPDISLRDILEISQDNNYDVVYSPILQGPGNAIGGTFIKPAAPHAGSTTSYEENGGDPDALPGDASVRQLENYKNTFEDARGTNQQGFCLLERGGGEVVPVPQRAGEMAEFSNANDASIVSGTEEMSLERTMDRYAQMTGNPVHFPSVY